MLSELLLQLSGAIVGAIVEGYVGGSESVNASKLRDDIGNSRGWLDDPRQFRNIYIYKSNIITITCTPLRPSSEPDIRPNRLSVYRHRTDLKNPSDNYETTRRNHRDSNRRAVVARRGRRVILFFNLILFLLSHLLMQNVGESCPNVGTSDGWVGRKTGAKSHITPAPDPAPPQSFHLRP